MVRGGRASFQGRACEGEFWVGGGGEFSPHSAPGHGPEALPLES